MENYSHKTYLLDASLKNEGLKMRTTWNLQHIVCFLCYLQRLFWPWANRQPPSLQKKKKKKLVATGWPSSVRGCNQTDFFEGTLAPPSRLHPGRLPTSLIAKSATGYLSRTVLALGAALPRLVDGVDTRWRSTVCYQTPCDAIAVTGTLLTFWRLRK